MRYREYTNRKLVTRKENISQQRFLRQGLSVHKRSPSWVFEFKAADDPKTRGVTKTE